MISVSSEFAKANEIVRKMTIFDICFSIFKKEMTVRCWYVCLLTIIWFYSCFYISFSESLRFYEKNQKMDENFLAVKPNKSSQKRKSQPIENDDHLSERKKKKMRKDKDRHEKDSKYIDREKNEQTKEKEDTSNFKFSSVTPMMSERRQLQLAMEESRKEAERKNAEQLRKKREAKRLKKEMREKKKKEAAQAIAKKLSQQSSSTVNKEVDSPKTNPEKKELNFDFGISKTSDNSSDSEQEIQIPKVPKQFQASTPLKNAIKNEDSNSNLNSPSIMNKSSSSLFNETNSGSLQKSRDRSTSPCPSTTSSHNLSTASGNLSTISESIARRPNRKINLKKVNQHGETKLHQAAIKGNLAEAQKLIDYGIEIDRRDYAGWTALHEACGHDSNEVAALLLRAGADVDAISEEQGFTPLHDAAMAQNKELIILLLRYGASTNIRGKVNNETCFDVCTPEFLPIFKDLVDQTSKKYRDERELNLATIRSKNKRKGKAKSSGGKIFDHESSSSSSDDENQDELGKLNQMVLSSQSSDNNVQVFSQSSVDSTLFSESESDSPKKAIKKEVNISDASNNKKEKKKKKKNQIDDQTVIPKTESSDQQPTQTQIKSEAIESENLPNKKSKKKKKDKKKPKQNSMMDASNIGLTSIFNSDQAALDQKRKEKEKRKKEKLELKIKQEKEEKERIEVEEAKKEEENNNNLSAKNQITKLGKSPLQSNKISLFSEEFDSPSRQSNHSRSNLDTPSKKSVQFADQQHNISLKKSSQNLPRAHNFKDPIAIQSIKRSRSENSERSTNSSLAINKKEVLDHQQHSSPGNLSNRSSLDWDVSYFN